MTTELASKGGVPVQARFHLGHHRGLDGIRGVAILLVLLVHGDCLPEGCAFIGVNSFFVLSGFLITCLLVEEWDARGKLNLKHFYLRRALRLLPALLAMLSIFLVLVFLTDPRKRAIREFHEALRALFYFTNWAKIFHIGRNVSLVHTWSLSIEEQFYLLWPFMLMFLLRKNSRSSLLCWIALGVFLSVLARIALQVGGTQNLSGTVLPLNPDRLVMGLDTRADALLTGCFTGVLVSSRILPPQNWFVKNLKIPAMVSGVGLLVLGNFWIMAPGMIYCGWLLASILAAVLILHVVTDSGTLVHRFLGNPILVYVGKISYGLYVWHFPILTTLKANRLPWKNLVYLLWVFPVALACYYLVEKPCLRLKKRFAEVE